ARSSAGSTMRCNGAWRRRRWRRRRRVDAAARVRGPVPGGLHPRDPPRRRRALQPRGCGAKASTDSGGGAERPIAARPGRGAARLVREAAARISTRRAAAARDPRMELEAWRSVGAVQRWRVGGPFAALRLFDLRRTLPLDGRVSSAATVNDRALEFPDGDAG